MRSSTDDPGLARERTLLAWQRMALSFGTLAVLVFVASLHRGDVVIGAATAVPLALFALVLRQRSRRVYEERHDLRTLEPDALGVRLVTGAAAVTAVAAVVLVLAG